MRGTTRRLRAAVVVGLLTLSGASCSSPVDADLGLTGNELAVAYVDYVIGVMRANSVNRLKIDWTAFTSTVRASASNAQSIAQTYPAIRTALTLLGDGHSTYRGVDGTVLYVPTRTCTAPTPTRPALPANIGYVRITGFSGAGAAADVFSQNIQDSIKLYDRVGLAGWIVDLRSNGGGNMWPMVAGVGPILGEAVLGYFIGPTGVESKWQYFAGTAFLDDQPIAQMLAAYRLKVENPRVAVLTDNRVASSGEAVAVAFRKRPNTITLGTATCGLSTANAGHQMPDGALLNLTGAVFADRTKATYGDQLQPDEVITDEAQLFQRAIGWLQMGQ